MFGFLRKKKPEELTPEQDAQVAQRALAAGDLQHAATHIGCALARDPTRREWLELLDRIAGIAADPLAIAPLEKENYFATVAVRAYLLARLNRRTEALDLLFQVAMAKPDVPYLEWAITWLEEPGRPDTVDARPAIWLFGHILENLPRFAHPEGDGAATMQRLPRLAEALRAAGVRDTHLAFIAASVLRRIGSAPLALEIAREAYAAQPSYEGSVAIACVLREQGDLAGALDAYRQALSFQPQDDSVRLDVADMLCQHERYAEAEQVYAEVLRVQPGHEWAEPSFYASQFKRTGDEQVRQQLIEYARAHPGNERARVLLQWLSPGFDGYLPHAREAIINGAREMLSEFEGKEKTPSGAVEITVSGLECPSAALAMRRELALLSPELKLELKVTKVASPDPRQPNGRVEFLLWRYQGTNAQPVLPAPPAPVAEAVAALAAQPYSLEAWRREAQAAAPRLRQVPVQQLLAAMTHPLPAPEGMRMWVWLPRVQLAAALIVSCLDGGWAGSLRRRALLAVANGPIDWSIEAALIALVPIAKEDPDAEREFTALCTSLFRRAPRDGYVCYMQTLARCALERPHLTPDERHELEELLKELDS